MTDSAPSMPRKLKQCVGLAVYRGRRRATKALLRHTYVMWSRRQRPSYARTLQHVVSRDELPALLNRRGLVGVAAEIGVKRGRYSALILERWRGSRLISIDPWLSVEPEEYVDRANVAQGEHERFYEEAVARLAPFGSRSEIWRLSSLDAALRVDDESLDFVYIDARHDYRSVAADLSAWYPKVRSGGILAGHDYADGRFPQGQFEVKRAVDEFAATRRLQVHVTSAPRFIEMFPSWLIEVV